MGDALLRSLLRDDPSPVAATTLDAFWPKRPSRGRESDPIEAAIVDGFAADRLAFAFAAGYHAALRALVPGGNVDAVVALAATEEGGAHPKAIRTHVENGALSGEKKWITLADVAKSFLVLATLGVDDAGRSKLRLVRVDRESPGISVEMMPETPFVPEIRHAVVRFDGVRVEGDAILAGDGWNDLVKPFRTIEDLHVHGALLGHLVGVARRFGWPEARVEALLASIVAVRALARLDPRAPEVHLALAGVLEASRAAVEACTPCWSLADEATRARWERDRPLLSVAARARDLRREAAWKALR